MKSSQEEILQIVAQIKKGDESAFEKLYDNYSGALLGVISRIVKSDEQANGVLQETFLKIWKNIAKYDPKKATPFTWMLNIARNSAIDSYRKTKKTQERVIQNSEYDVSDIKGPMIEQRIDHIGLAEIMGKLNPDQQTVVNYVYFKGYTQQEVSDELGIPLGTVKTRVRSALIDLRKLMN